MDGFDDLAGVDAPKVDRGHAEVAAPELALDDVDRRWLTRRARARVRDDAKPGSHRHRRPSTATFKDLVKRKVTSTVRTKPESTERVGGFRLVGAEE